MAGRRTSKTGVRTLGLEREPSSSACITEANGTRSKCICKELRSSIQKNGTAFSSFKKCAVLLVKGSTAVTEHQDRKKLREEWVYFTL